MPHSTPLLTTYIQLGRRPQCQAQPDALNNLRARGRTCMVGNMGVTGGGNSTICQHFMVAGQAIRAPVPAEPADLDAAAAATFPAGHGASSLTNGVILPYYEIPSTAGPVTLLDVEGWGAAQNTATNHDVSLAVFLNMVCSCIMVNTLYGRTDQANQVNIFRALSQARQLLLEGKDGLSFKPPSIIILVRNCLKGVTAAKVKEGLLEQLKKSPMIGDQERALVEDAEVIAVPTPAPEDDMWKLDTMKFSDLKPSYKDAVHFILKRMAERVVPKNFDGTHLTGHELCEIALGTVELLNQGVLRKVAGCYVALLMRRLQQHAEVAMKMYETRMQPMATHALQGDDSILEAAHNDAVAAALAEFERLCESIGREDLVADEVQKLQDDFSKIKQLVTAERNKIRLQKQAEQFQKQAEQIQRHTMHFRHVAGVAAAHTQP